MGFQRGTISTREVVASIKAEEEEEEEVTTIKVDSKDKSLQRK
jgi:hypothetical protein